MAIVKISDLPMVDEPVQGTDLFVVVQDNVTKKAFASDIQTYVGFEEVQTATAGQTVFNLTTMTYAAGANNLMVFVDGVNQYEGSSYQETDNNTVTFTQGLHEGALVKFSTVQTQTSEVANANAVTFLQAGTGAIPRSVQSKERDIVSVKDFGAQGDGVTDDTAAIQAALTYAAANNKRVFVPGGSYLFTTLTFPLYEAYLEGEGRDLVTFTTSTTGNAITVGRARSGISGIKLVQSNAGTGKGIVGPSNGCDWFQCQDVQTFGFDYGLYMQKSVYQDYRECEFGDGNTGAEFVVTTGIPNGDWFNNAHSFIDCKFHNHTNNGINWGGIGATFINCDASSCDVGFYIHGSSDANNSQAFAASFTGCYVENTDTPFWFNDARGTINQCFMAGQPTFSPSGSGYYTAPVRATGIRTQVEIGICKIWGYWLYKALIDQAATLVYSIDGLTEVLAYNTTFGTGSIRQAIFGKQTQTDGLISLPDTRVSVNSPQPATLASRIETNAAGSNVNAEYLIRKDSTGTNRTSEPPTLVLVNDATPTANQMVRLAFGASSPGLPQNFNGTISADIRVVFPTTGGNGRSSRVVIGTTDESVSQSPVDRFYVKETGSVVYIPLASAPSSPTAGEVYYDSGTNKLRCYNGTTWNDLF